MITIFQKQSRKDLGFLERLKKVSHEDN